MSIGSFCYVRRRQINVCRQPSPDSWVEFLVSPHLKSRVLRAQMVYGTISIALTAAERTFICCINFSVGPSVRILERISSFIHSFIRPSVHPSIHAFPERLLWVWPSTWGCTARKAMIFILEELMLSRETNIYLYLGILILK